MTKQAKTSDERDYAVGPNGEKRPKEEPEASANRVMRIVTGLTKEEYVEKAKPESK